MPDAPEPLSWLTLERYALGELDDAERADVEARLAASPADRACLAEITSDRSELPPLVAPSASSLSPGRIHSLEAARKRQRIWLGVSAGLCAAAALLALLREPAQDAGEGVSDGIKGADVALRLISAQQGESPRHFSAGERFKIEVTCPPALSASMRMLIAQGDEVFEPAPRASDFRCGNLVAWPGAFALDGDLPADVCMYWGPAAQPTRAELARDSVCSRLEVR